MSKAKWDHHKASLLKTFEKNGHNYASLFQERKINLACPLLYHQNEIPPFFFFVKFSRKSARC